MNKGLFLAPFAALALAACASSAEQKAARERNPAPCPNIVVLDDAARLVEFAGDKREIEAVAWSAEVVDVQLACRYFADKPIDAEVEVSLAFGRGPAAVEAEKNYQYFVAVTRTDREVIAKEVFTVPVKFDGKRRVRSRKEKIDSIKIPRAREGISGTNFEVVVGLVLTPQQAVYNRSGKSLKFPDLEK